MNNHYECLLWGGYGFGNTGDELTLAVALHDQRRRGGDSVAILSRNPDYTRSLFPGVPVIAYCPHRAPLLRRTLSRRLDRWAHHGGPTDLRLARYRLADQLDDAGSWARTLPQCNRLHLVGGGYLSDLFGLDYLLLPVVAARANALPISTSPLGLGPFASRAAATHVADLLRPVQLAVRDTESLAFCRQHQLPAELRPDDGFRVLEILSELAHAASAARSALRPRIGICIFRQHGDRDRAAAERWWQQFLQALKAGAEPVEVEGFCFHTNPALDYDTARTRFQAAGLAASAVRRPDPDFRAALRDLRRYDVIVSARFHAIVVANALSIPHVAVAFGDYYRAKMAAAVRRDDPGSRLVSSLTASPEELARQVVALAYSRPAAGPPN
jgi:polysaccharide pyruvyl transferase WcaK-like protein